MTWFRIALFCASSVFWTAPPLHAEIDLALLAGDFDFDQIDALIAENADDPVLVFDLLGEKSTRQLEAGDITAAAETAAIRAAFAAQFPDLIAADLPALYWDAGDLFVQAGQPEIALDQYYTALDGLRDRAAKRDLMGALMRQIADLERDLGRSETAAALRAQASALPEPLDAPPATRSNDPGYVSVDVYYATDRARTGKAIPSRFYGYDRASGLELGMAEVTIPNSHLPGTISTRSIWRLEFSDNPAKHMMVQSVTPMDPDSFFGDMRAALEERAASDAFIFVHGYNVSFDNAAKRTAQLAHDMNFRGLPVLFSWPSRGAATGYIPDTAVVRLSGRRLTQFLDEFVARSGATTVHIIAHSMGNRAVTDALELMALRRGKLAKPVFDQIIFAAPDVDQGLFAEMISTIRPLARRLTLYASENDWALAASRKLHGNTPRAGQGGNVVLAHDEIDSVDMTGLGADMLEHSYVANDQSAIVDISTLFWLNLDPKERCGLEARAQTAGTWEYHESECSNQNVLNLIGLLRNEGARSRSEVRDTLQQKFGDDPQVKQIAPILLNLADH